MFCAHCGAQLADDARFCAECGNPVTAAPAPPPAAPAEEAFVPPTETFAPAAEALAPPPETFAPSEEVFTPPPETAAPSEEAFVPPPEPAAPAEEAFTPPTETPAPPQETFAPSAEAAAPAAAPAEDATAFIFGIQDALAPPQQTFTPPPETPPRQTFTPPPETFAPPQNTFYPPARPDAPRQAAEKPQRAGWKIAVIVALLAVLLAGAGWAVWSMFLRPADEPSDEDDEIRLEDDRDDAADREDDRDDRDQPADSTARPPQGGETDDATPAPADAAAPAAPQTVQIEIHQVDAAAFPDVTFYASVLDEDGRTVSGLSAGDFALQEWCDGLAQPQTLRDARPLRGAEPCSISLVLDASDAMAGPSMTRVLQSGNHIVDHMDFAAGDQVSVLAVHGYASLEQDFTGDDDALYNAVGRVGPAGAGALYDTLYAALDQAGTRSGERCVVAFTGGRDAGSGCTFDDVAALSGSLGIPVYLVGIGVDNDSAAILQALAQQCGGAYYPVGGADDDAALDALCASLCERQQNAYVFRYTASNPNAADMLRSLELSLTDRSAYRGGSGSRVFYTQSVVNEGFDSAFRDQDYILPNSGTTPLTAADLSGLSLAQLRIARNEIFARHGRQFNDAWLRQWFQSKDWYLAIPTKYTPAEFDAMPSPLSAVELNNIELIVQYEDTVLASRDIFPNAATVPLTDYDLALTKDLLERALAQMRTYGATQILQDNIARVEAAIRQTAS